MKRAKVIAVVGAGGKTTHIHQLADSFRKQGKYVVVTTTTHMLREPDNVLSGEEEDVCIQLEKDHYCMVGTPAMDGKIGPVSEELFRRLEEIADFILVEADGSKCMPAKMPSNEEPVIPKDCDEIHIMMGLNAIGNTFESSAHRLSVITQQLQVKREDVIKPYHIEQMIEMGYAKPLAKKYPNAKLFIYPTHISNDYEQRIASNLMERKSVKAFSLQVDLILLAAGSSTRFGPENKLLQMVEGKELFSYAIETARVVKKNSNGVVDKIIVVSGYEKIASYVENLPDVEYVYNGSPQDGVSLSIKKGVEAANPNHALMFMVCDQPNLQVETVDGLIHLFMEESALAGSVRRADGSTGNPCIFSPKLQKELLQLSGDVGGKSILRTLDQSFCCYYDVSQNIELLDVDTPEELNNMK